MTVEQFKKLRIITTSFASASVAIAVVENNIILALAGVTMGVLFLTLVKRTVKTVLIDERTCSIGSLAARRAFIFTNIFWAVLGLGASLAGQLNVNRILSDIGVLLSFVVVINIAVYSVLYKYSERKFSGDDSKQD